MTGLLDRPRDVRRTASRRGFVVALLAALAVLLPQAPASAHATLVGSDPPDGAVVQTSPEVISLTFDETVSLTPTSVQVFDAAGKPVPTKAKGRDRVVSASIPADLPDGTYVVAWRVLSSDSHPVAGSLSFSIGAPSATVVPPKTAAASDPTLTRTLSITGAFNYVSLFLAAGLVLFSVWVLRDTELLPRVQDRLTMTSWIGASIAVFTAANAIVLQGAEDLGLGADGVGDSATLDPSLVGNEMAVFVLQVLGLAAALLVRRRNRWVATVGALVAVASPALVGHSRSNGPLGLVLPADVVHLIAGAGWFGGLVGLAIVLGPLRGQPRVAATVLARFSTLGASLLAALVVTGAVASWRIVGSWSALVDTGYGRVLLVKVGVVGVAAVVAAFNRWRLLPRLTHGVGHGDRTAAAASLRRTVTAEALVLVAVLVLTGFLTNLSPNPPAATQAPVASRVAATVVGKTRVLATLSPGTVGRNTLTVQAQDQAGEPIEGYAAPAVSVSSGQVDLGTLPAHPVASGTYAAEVVLPHKGAWTVRVSLRQSRFDNPVTEVTVHVR